MTALADAATVDDHGAGASESEVPHRWLPTRATWPLWFITAGMPVAFLLGFHGLAFPLVSVVLGARIIRHPRTVIPWAAVPLAIFVMWAALSISVVPPHSWLMFLYRYLLFFGALVIMIWVANIDRKTLPTSQVIDWMAWLWITTIAFGYLAQLLPKLNMPSLTTLAFGPAAKIDFINRITQWHLADHDEFLTTSFTRPAAPWAATNSWGAAIGMLTPFFVQSWLIDVPTKRRRIGLVLLALSALPILYSANRGMWLALILGFVYFTARRAMRGRWSAVIVLLAGIAIMAVALVATPAGTMVQSRLDGSTASNTTREYLYTDAWAGAKKSPLIGNGVPKHTQYSKHSPPVGTHGLIWYLMFIHGFPGLFLLLGWMALEVVVSAQLRTPQSWGPHLCLVISLIEVPYYGLQPHIMLTAIAAGLIARETVQPLGTAAPEPPSPPPPPAPTIAAAPA